MHNEANFDAESSDTQKKRSPGSRRHPPSPKLVIRAAARTQKYDFQTEAGCRGYLKDLVDTVGKPSLNGEIFSNDPAVQEMLLTLGVLGTAEEE